MRKLFAVALTVLWFAPLFAQTTPPPPQPQPKTAEEEKKPKVTEEMVVTARKREETVQEVPESVAAPTESELRDRGAETLEDVAANVAGFTVQNLGPGQSQIAIRGVSSGQIVRDQPGVKEQVGVYLDESVISLSLFTPDIDLFKPNDKLSITPRFLYQKLDMNGWNRVDAFNILANPFTTSRPAVTLGKREQFTQFQEPTTDKFGLGDVNVSYNLGGSTLTSVT